jgi:SAM-dependent methyltransferase
VDPAHVVAPTFRDPSGSLIRSGGRIFRIVHPHAAEALTRFLGSEIAQALQKEGSLVRSWRPAADAVPSSIHAILDAAGAGALLIEHEPAPFTSFPYEWGRAQLGAAAAHTLGLCQRLLQHGWVLKDATPFNLQFFGPRPVWVDVLSVAPAAPASGLWPGYAQFVRTFLLPLLAERDLGWPLTLLQQHREGYEPAAVHASLGWWQRWRAPARSLVTLPAMFEHASSGQDVPRIALRPMAPEAARFARQRTLRSLHRSLAALMRWRPRPSRWALYAAECAHYSKADRERKQTVVREALRECAAARVLDLGCNTGEYSRLAAESGAYVVGVDADAAAIGRAGSGPPALHERFLPLVVDIARPTPATGWENRECASFLDRARGAFDMLLALALAHHLIVIERIPMPAIAALFATLTSRACLVEWVPPSDAKFRALLRGRDALYAGITEEAFLAAFQSHFRLRRREPLAGGRVLYLFER